MEITNEIMDYLKKSRQSKDICQKFGCTDRAWRQAVNDFNQEYDKQEKLIVADKFGYRLTTDKKLIKSYAFRRINHALSELKNGKRILKTLQEKDFISILDEEVIDLRDIAMRFLEDGRSR